MAIMRTCEMEMTWRIQCPLRKSNVTNVCDMSWCHYTLFKKCTEKWGPRKKVTFHTDQRVFNNIVPTTVPMQHLIFSSINTVMTSARTVFNNKVKPNNKNPVAMPIFKYRAFRTSLHLLDIIVCNKFPPEG
jgi:hypothetical protein